MDRTTFLETVENWHGPFDGQMQNRAMTALEGGMVIVLENLSFKLKADETMFLNPAISGNARKNISFDPKSRKISNATLEVPDQLRLGAMMDRFGNNALGFLKDLLPSYAPYLQRGRTSFRPTEIKGRSYSPRQDDKRLHVDAFPSRPVQGQRILRLFTNVASDGTVRHWQVGEPFDTFAQRFMPRLKRPLPGHLSLLERLGITKGKRSLYDHYMIQLHDYTKLDSSYQMHTPKTDIFFKPGVTWLCFTDQVLHAALSGCAALEQTFYLPVNAMANPSMAPLRILEGMAGRRLV